MASLGRKVAAKLHPPSIPKIFSVPENDDDQDKESSPPKPTRALSSRSYASTVDSLNELSVEELNDRIREMKGELSEVGSQLESVRGELEQHELMLSQIQDMR
jgi:ribosomal protein L29